MTVTTTVNKSTHSANGVTTSWPFAFLIPTTADVEVIVTSAAGAESTISSSAYSITGLGNAGGGTVTYPTSGSPLAAGNKLTIRRKLAIKQTTDLVTGAAFYAEDHEEVFDRHTMVDQQQQEELDRSLKFPVSDGAMTVTLPVAASRANKAIVFDASGNVAVSVDNYNDQAANAAASAAAASSSATAADASEAAALASQVAAAASAALALTSEQNADTSEAAAAAASAAALASQTAAATSEANALAYRDAAQTAAANAATSEANADTSEAVAVAAASTATTQAGIATTKAGEAAASAVAADASADAAAVSETNAADSAAAAAASAGAVNLPSAAGHGTHYIRQKATEDGFEYRTPSQVLADIGGQSASDVQAQLTVVNAALQNVRDQGVLTALRQMLSTSVSTGALVRGKEWELSTDEWGATSTGEGYVNGAISYYTQQVGADTTFTSGSGTYTVPAGVTTIQVKMWGAGGGGNPGPATFGQGGGGGGFYMATLSVTPGQTFSYSVGAGGSPGNAGGNSTFNGVTANGGGGGASGASSANAGVGPTENGQQGLWSGSQTANSRAGGNAGGVAYGGGTGGGNASGNPSGGYAGNAPGGGGGGGSSQQSGGYGGNGANGSVVITPVYAVTLAVPAAVTINSAPTYADLYFLWKDDSGTGLTAPSGTVRLSRDGGTTKATAALTVEAAFDSTYSIIRARADVSGQPTGTALWADVDYGTVKQRFAAPALLGE